VADADDTPQRLGLEALGQAVELALRPAPLEPAADQGRHAGAVVAAVLQPPQRVQQHRRCQLLANHAHDPAHVPSP
jgi:hypothetical protein